ncbi:MAG: hypothetical protein H6832_06495 [Planctomycetes bacterium]|nr:hypothetical protein [Planctomycetota bacterium]MCB9918036.1 hypothetical protein [Planctomycetota bacterium]
MRIVFGLCFWVFVSAMAFPRPCAGQRLVVYVLAGQSNMEGHAKVTTFDYLADDPGTVPLLERMRTKDGAPVVRDDVFIAYRTGADGAEVMGRLTTGFGARRDPAKSDDKIGPEFTFGIEMGDAHEAPVLIIKTAWGGKSLHTDFRPPSAGAYEFSKEQLARLEKQAKNQNKDIEELRRAKEEATGRYYRDMVAYVRKVLADLPRYCPDHDPADGYELRGFVWFQGWNDMVDRDTYPLRDQPGGYAEYTKCLAHFIRDVRRDFETPDLPFVIGVMGVGGEITDPKREAVQLNFRKAMAQAAALSSLRNVIAVETAPFWEEPLEAISEKLDRVRQFERMLRTKNPGFPNADGSMDAKAQQAAVAKFRSDLLSDEEERTWLRGASNGGYHYLGCAKTMARIGLAFAKALELESR